MKKSLLASALTVLALAAVPAAAQAATTSTLLRVSPTPVPTDMTSESPTEMTSESPTETTSESPTETTSESPGAATVPFGPGCSSLPTSGPGSPSSMATEPVGTALSSNPELSILAKAVHKAGLTDTLNSAKDLTVFAPTDKAFAKIPGKTLDKILGDKAQLTKVLQNHVVEGRKAPADLSQGTLNTLGGGTLTVKGSGEDYTVNDAKVLCGNLQTSNATVYLVDTVLLPK
ncbi:fasciclin domain-containing protein [Streptosporangium sp. NPDC087985]|uniref:fasciclin domain-containing protein n=1 Tax=Streptosporangium sp. NPDC087985 TaxID=3366196 RepID=UPI0038198E02